MNHAQAQHCEGCCFSCRCNLAPTAIRLSPRPVPDCPVRDGEGTKDMSIVPSLCPDTSKRPLHQCSLIAIYVGHPSNGLPFCGPRGFRNESMRVISSNKTGNAEKQIVGQIFA